VTSPSLTFPLIIPVYQKQADGTFELDNFVQRTTRVCSLQEELNHRMVNVLGMLKEWTHSACTTIVPCCLLTGHGNARVTALFYCGRKETFATMQHCLRKLKLWRAFERGSVVHVEGNIYIRSYSAVLSYVLDAPSRQYLFSTCCVLPARMHFCKWSARGLFALLDDARKLREQQIQTAHAYFMVLCLVPREPVIVFKYCVHPCESVLQPRNLL